ncbi:helix-turn-helix domain-containing protein [Frondihabitans australicus]|uniref:Transcriptional regulator with XRE-family HTH domain n=1 Tax=Frondihabitans australicus TaxID=386892 RepID=A0A495ILP9_9MICO|nr:helix-turn-helix transcriptional regulator [Frondihabitans australicus]RKR76358.1 transcriptional regulator with XRE-family HTH domain [Frondihabitans australicus]
MNSRSTLLGDYLRTRRDLVQPEDIGLLREPNRRVKGLRREEVAALAGISPEYYLRLEQGHAHQPSEQVLNSLGRALDLDPAAIDYLHRLARPSNRTESNPRSRATKDELQRLLRRTADRPAFVIDDNMDVVAANPLAEVLGPGAMSTGSNRLVRMFSDECRGMYDDWAERAAEMVAVLRMRADPESLRLQQIVGELSMHSVDFRLLWARHDVHVFTSGTCLEMIQPFGAVEFEYDDLRIMSHPDLTLTTLYAAPGSIGAGVIAYASARLTSATETADIDLLP